MSTHILNAIQTVLDHRNQPPLPPPSPSPSTPPPPPPRIATTPILPPKLGAAYNIFDGEELLEQSIRSIRPLVSYVVVVYQTRSNFGEPCSSSLVQTLIRLRDQEHLIDTILPYTTQHNFTNAEKKHWVSARATGTDLGGAKYFDVADPFFNEIAKREAGRQSCLDHQCTHFMSMDTDEFYRQKDLSLVWNKMMAKDYDSAVCKMRFFFKFPRCELYPKDEQNYVTCMFKLEEDMPLRLCHPYCNLLIDPTRRMFGATKLLVCTRDEMEMYHYSFVRLNIVSKLMNVTNRGNYKQNELESFIRAFPNWSPTQPLSHPHPYFAATFTTTRMVPNWFNIDLGPPYNWETFTSKRCTLEYTHEQEMTLKKSAIQHFKDHNYTDARDLYEELSRRAAPPPPSKKTNGTAAKDGLDSKIAYMVNSATCALKMKQYGQAIVLCNVVLERGNGSMTEGTHAKTLYTRALARFSLCTGSAAGAAVEEAVVGEQLRNIDQCRVDLEMALSIKKNSPSIKKLLKKIKKCL